MKLSGTIINPYDTVLHREVVKEEEFALESTGLMNFNTEDLMNTWETISSNRGKSRKK